jgi:hypothetical protein
MTVLLLRPEPHLSSSLEHGTSGDCFDPRAALYSHCRATDYGDKRLVK